MAKSKGTYSGVHRTKARETRTRAEATGGRNTSRLSFRGRLGAGQKARALQGTYANGRAASLGFSARR